MSGILSRRVTRANRGYQAHAATQQQDPPENQRRCQRGDGRQQDRERPQQSQYASLDQEQNPVLVNRRADGGGDPFNLGRLADSHERIPLNGTYIIRSAPTAPHCAREAYADTRRPSTLRQA